MSNDDQHIRRPDADLRSPQVDDVEGHIKRPEADFRRAWGDDGAEGHIKRPEADIRSPWVDDDVEGHIRLRDQGPVDGQNEIRRP